MAQTRLVVVCPLSYLAHGNLVDKIEQTLWNDDDLLAALAALPFNLVLHTRFPSHLSSLFTKQKDSVKKSTVFALRPDVDEVKSGTRILHWIDLSWP